MGTWAAGGAWSGHSMGDVVAAEAVTRAADDPPLGGYRDSMSWEGGITAVRMERRVGHAHLHHLQLPPPNTHAALP